MVKVINGVTKAGVHKDQKKEDNRLESRQKVEVEEFCRQCYFPLTGDLAEGDGFCSDSCKEYFEEQFVGDCNED